MRLLVPLLFTLSLAAACEPPSDAPANSPSEAPPSASSESPLKSSSDLAVSPPSASPAESPSDASAMLISDDDKVIYSVGVTVARSIAMLDLDEREIEILNRGMADRLFDRPLAVDLSEYAPKMTALAKARMAQVAQREREASKAFLAQAAAVPGAVTTESGLIYKETKAGTGSSPGPTDRVKVDYHGTLRDGTVFDSSRDRGEPGTFALNRVIACWSEALQMMKVGGRATIVCPADIAYGDRGTGEIKPGAALRFDVELISIE
jgi:FKBP-type peptidyl-prolyl cis-trans isomerase FkpA